jgi:alginate O-acetyltransferase complex protein AlgI
MNFVSLDYYLLFLPIVVGLYYVFRSSILANLVILVASYIFYGSSGLWFLAPLIVTSLIDFYVGLKLATIDEWRKTLLAVSLIANLGLLAFFKYTPWLINSINEGFAAAGLSLALPVLSVVLPSPGDFWHRWHISLSTWLRDYLYIPLGGTSAVCATAPCVACEGNQ